MNISNSLQNSTTQLELERASRNTHELAQILRGEGTKKQYEPKVAEWKAWCQAKLFPEETRYTVNGPKLHLFLTDEVINRPNRKNSSKKIQYSTITAYVNAIVDLWKFQKNQNINNFSHPRLYADTSLLLSNYRKQTATIKRENFEDRGAYVSLLQGLTRKEEIADLSMFYLKDERNGLRNRSMELLSYGGLLRGENVRDIEFLDMFLFELEGMEYSKCFALIALMDHGKTNPFGK
jgi:hypothetical protein